MLWDKTTTGSISIIFRESKVNPMKLKIGDFVITGIVLAAALFIALSFTGEAKGSLIAVVTKDGQVIKRINLSELGQPIEFEVSGKYHNRIRAERGRIHFVEADCPDDICVQTGWLGKAGQVAACLPNGVLIKLEGSAGDIDTYLH